MLDSGRTHFSNRKSKMLILISLTDAIKLVLLRQAQAQKQLFSIPK